MALAAAGSWGCASTPPPSTASAAPVSEWPELYRGALTDYVPSAGLRWLLVGNPRYFALHPELRPLRESWLTDARFTAFATATGVDLRRTEQALAAGFDLGTLYMADASGWVAPPEAPFEERLAGSGTVHRPHPQIWRVTGLVGSVPQALVRVDHHLAAVSVGDLVPARVVELRARGRLANVTRALDGAALSDLPAELTTPGPLRFYAPGPFEGEWLSDRRGLIAGASALAAALDLEAETCHLRVALTGDWEPARDREHLLQAWHALASSSVGRLLALDPPQQPAEVDASARSLVLSVRLHTRSLLAGIERLLAQDVEELLNVERSAGQLQMPH